MSADRSTYVWRWLSACAVAIAAVACGDSTNVVDPPTFRSLSCTIPNSEIFSGAPGKDGIRALTNPTMVLPNSPDAEYLLDDDRVIGLVIDDEILAIPLNILWWHEIVNLDVAGRRVAVTHCPLTGSSLVFDRAQLGGAELGVSGLLYRNNLMMYDRNDDESLWPQMARGARCGVRSGEQLEMVPSWEMSWQGWQTLHPQTLVVSSKTRSRENYRFYPYGDYDLIDNPQLLFPMESIDERRPPKERTLGIPGGDGGRAYPFGMQQHIASKTVVQGENDVIFWDGSFQAAMAYYRVLDGDTLDFRKEGFEIRDSQTESVWRIDGVAVSGPLAGRRLEPVAEAYVSYWFAWAAFHPNATLLTAP